MQRRPLSAVEKRDWIRLSRTGKVGPITFRQLLRRYETAAEALRVLPELSRRGGGNQPPAIPSIAQIEDEIAATEKIGGKFIALCEPEYSEPLASVDDAPPVITVIGQTSLLSKKAIGIVGARNASLNGRKMAEILATGLGKENIAVVSGLARGIDAAAHRASLSTGTIAVLAGGADVIYPEENRDLYEEIREHGLILSDQPLGTEPIARLFPRRNRLISGLSRGVVVVEAAIKSGSLITARFALEQGREVFAVPGSPLDPRANGTNALLREGAILVEKSADILGEIDAPPRLLAEPKANYDEGPIAAENEAEIAAARGKILEILSPSPSDVDELIRRCHLPPSHVLTVLLELELAGRLERQPGKKVALISVD
jgi:DNA processing protein